MRRGIGVLLCALGLVSCATLRPDFQNLYGRFPADASQPPVILVPGLMGSTLRDGDGDEAWPGSLAELVFRDPARLALPIDPETLRPERGDLEVGGLTERVAGREFYRAIVQLLHDAGGYQRGDPSKPVTDGRPRYYVFPYDWRRDNAETARAFADFVDRVAAAHGDPSLKVDVIAHSMGGLMVRYYARYGRADVLEGNDFPVNLDGARHLRRVVLLGTPNFGSVRAVQGFMVGYDLTVTRLPPEVLVTFPSVYQLFPHALSDWLLLPDGRPLQRDVFDVETWRRFGWSVFDRRVRTRIAARGAVDLPVLERYFERNLERGRRFLWSLSVETPPGEPRYVVMGGDCTLTPARMVIEEEDGDSVVRLKPSQVRTRPHATDLAALMLEPGDGTVTKASLLARDVVDPRRPRHRFSHFPVAQTVLLCEQHASLTSNPSFQDNLLHSLLDQDR